MVGEWHLEPIGSHGGTGKAFDLFICASGVPPPPPSNKYRYIGHAVRQPVQIGSMDAVAPAAWTQRRTPQTSRLVYWRGLSEVSFEAPGYEATVPYLLMYSYNFRRSNMRIAPGSHDL